MTQRTPWTRTSQNLHVGGTLIVDGAATLAALSMAALTLSGVLKAADGTVGAPGISFSADLDSGVYRIGANNVGVAVNGAKVLDVSATGLGVTGTVLNGNGAVGAPAYSYSSDPDTGTYRIGANNLGIAAAGAKVLDIAAQLTQYVGELKSTTQLTQTKSINYSMLEADSGYRTYVDTDAVVITLPGTIAGATYEFVNAGADGAVGFSLSPNAADRIFGAGLTSADDKDLINTKATAKKGDMVRLVGDGLNGWGVQAMTGTWARE